MKLEHAQKRLNEYTMETLDWVFEYWRLKRKSNKNEQLVREDDKEPEAANAEQRYRKITQLRTDLEKSRNLLCLIIKREKVKRQILRCEREIAIKELKFFGQKVQMSDNTAAELAKAETETETIKTEADVAANFLEELDFSPRKEPEPKPKPTPTPKNKMKHRRAGPKSITRPNAPKAVPTFEQRKFFYNSVNYYGIYLYILAKTEIKPEPKPEPNRVPVHHQPPAVPIQNSAPTARPKLSRPGQPQFQLPNQPKAPSPINISNPSMRTNQKPGSRGKQPIQFAPRVSSPNPSQRITVTQSQPGNKGGIFIKNRLPGPGPIRPGVRPFRNQVRANGPHNMQNGPHHGPHGPHSGPDGPNGPRMQNGEGRTVIGTKTVDGRQQEITMNNSVLRQNTRVSQVTNPNAPVKGKFYNHIYNRLFTIF